MFIKQFTSNEVDDFCELFDAAFSTKLNDTKEGDALAAVSDTFMASRIQIEYLRGKIDGLYEVAKKWFFARKYVNLRVEQINKQIDYELLTLQKLCEKYGLF